MTYIRDNRDFAIEHAGYLADAVERVLRGDQSWLDAEVWANLERLVYEFRKRAARAITATAGRKAEKP